ncbi:MAG: hypothetical protein M3R30_09785 [Candidatus Eremiobacteraeota bacterium]|nr:hypothetical protein [Candidatus Eremiobacteraeota bacterium]
MNRLAVLAAAAVLSAGMFGAGAVSTSQASAQTMPSYLRGERGSAHDLLAERTRIETVIDHLQRDRHDYGGHRETALDLLQRSRAEIQAAIDYDATHRGR